MPVWKTAFITAGATVLLGLGLLAGMILSDGRRPATEVATGAEPHHSNEGGKSTSKIADGLLLQGQGVYAASVLNPVSRHATEMVQAPVDSATRALENRVPGFLAGPIAELGAVTKVRLRDSAVETARDAGKTGFDTLGSAMTPSPAVDPTPWWSIELGRFVQLSSAEAFAQQLASMGVGTRTTMVPGDNGRQWVAVRAGLYADQALARKALEDLNKKGFTGSLVSETKGSSGYVAR